MPDRSDDRSRRLLGLARQAAQRLQHDYIGTGHILLGLLADEASAGARILASLGADAAQVREEVQRRMTPGPIPVSQGQLPFTPAAKDVLEATLREAVDLGHDTIGSQHLLLGLLHDAGIAGDVLRQAGVRIEAAREAVVKATAAGLSAPEPPGLPASLPPVAHDAAYGPEAHRALWRARLLAGERGIVTPTVLMHASVAQALEVLGVERPAALDADAFLREVSKRLAWVTGKASGMQIIPTPEVAFSPAGLVVLGEAHVLAGARGDSRIGLADLMDALVKDDTVPDSIPAALGKLRVADVRAWAERVRLRGG